jgi:DNA mismatch endonuclease (patch repair protein)
MMADIFSKDFRSLNMSKINSKNTVPEVKLRKLLWKEGYRFRKNVKWLPGKPDIVFTKKRKVIFVNGCFWHQHGCKRSSVPKSNTEYWIPKLAKNKERDIENINKLQNGGWQVFVVWECMLTGKEIGKTMEKIKQFLDSDGLQY